MDGQNPAPLRNPWNVDSPCKYQQTMVSSMVSKWSSGFRNHPQYDGSTAGSLAQLSIRPDRSGSIRFDSIRCPVS